VSTQALFIQSDAKKINNAIDLAPFDKASIVITGASGLVGQYMLAALSNAQTKGIQPKKIYLFVRNEPSECLRVIAKNLNVTWCKGDICDHSQIANLPNGLDYIIHAAGYGQPQKFLENEISTIMMNTAVTDALLKKLAKDGSFVFISTSEIYSGSKETPYKESIVGQTNTDHPRACYIEGKRCGEAIVNAYHKQGFDAKSIRLALAYGPGVRLDDRRVMNEVIKKGLIDQKIALMDSGVSLRTYIYITDAVEFMFKILLKGKSNIYNLSGKSRTSIAQMAQFIGQCTSAPLSIPQSDVGLAGAPEDVSLSLDRLLGEFPKENFVSFEAGVQTVIAWYRLLLDNFENNK
jgi:UDP-glucuronate decarboxylase